MNPAKTTITHHQNVVARMCLPDDPGNDFID
jgi:hypothetical protein